MASQSQSRPRSAHRNEGPSSSLLSEPEAISKISEDPQTVFLNRPRSSTTTSRGSQRENSSDALLGPGCKSTAVEPRKCWICLNDETEDTPLDSAWCSPCPCALTAHESCLLQWIDSGSALQRTWGSPQKVSCPQCKGEIVVSRPYNFLTIVANRVQRYISSLMLVSGIFGACNVVYYALFRHGLQTLFVVFGPQDYNKIIRPLNYNQQYQSTIQQASLKFLRNWRLNLGIPLIPCVLVLCRTDLAHGILPIAPIIFLLPLDGLDGRFSLGSWPPSSALTFSLLPYLREFYNVGYESVKRKLQQRWLKQIHANNISGDTRNTSNDNNTARNNNVDPWDVPGDDDAIIDIEIEIRDQHDEDDAEMVMDQGWARRDAARGPAPPLDAPQNAVEQAPIVADQPAPVPEWNRRDEHIFSPQFRLVDSVVGALLFPSIAAGMGGLLKLALPSSWVVPSGRPTGLLQTRWGRSIIGGGLFVVVKDVVVLYVRWKIATNWRKRNIVNYKEKELHNKKTFSGSTGGGGLA